MKRKSADGVFSSRSDIDDNSGISTMAREGTPDDRVRSRGKLLLFRAKCKYTSFASGAFNSVNRLLSRIKSADGFRRKTTWLQCVRARGASMPYQDFRQFLDVLRQHGELIDVN